MNQETLLEYRYRRLLRLYPRSWRSEREEEMVATYLDAEPAPRTRPSTADTIDVLHGAARHRLGTAEPGLRTATAFVAELALVATSVLGALWFCLFELAPMPDDYLLPSFGAFQSLGAVVWIAWAAVPLAGLFLSGRTMRAAVGTALILTALAVPAAELTPFIRPYLTILVPQFALGVVALFLADRRRPLVRALPVAALFLTAGTALGTGPWDTALTYRSSPVDGWILTTAAFALPAAAVAYAIAHRHHGGVWAPLVMLGPATLLLLERIPGPANTTSPNYTDVDVLIIGALVAAGAATMLAAAAARRVKGRHS